MDMHNILHEFEFWPDGTTYHGTLEHLKINVSTFSRLLLI